MRRAALFSPALLYHVVQHEQYVSQLFLGCLVQLRLYQLPHSFLLSLRQRPPPASSSSPHKSRAAPMTAAAPARQHTAQLTIQSVHFLSSSLTYISCWCIL
nr:MAG TPA_asm: hypothetical protein [Caudoviricetes sp.]